MTAAELADLIQRFAMHGLTFRRLYKHDAEFRAACDDHQAAVAAMHHFAATSVTASNRVEEYRRLVKELEAEIEARLSASEAHLMGARHPPREN
jgi:hypothetical protein